MTLDQLLDRPVATISPQATCAQAAKDLAQQSVGCLVVVSDGRPLGVVTDRDLVVSVMARGREATEVTVNEVMSGHPIMLRTDRGLGEIIDEISDFAVRRLPLIDEKGSLRGLISIDDVLIALADQFHSLSRTLRRSTNVAVSETNRSETS